MLEPGTLIRGKYQIQKLIGRGGMSTVYLATDHVSGYRYAIKDVERQGEDQNRKVVVQSLAAEGHMLKRLSNPHLPRIHDVIEDVNSFMLVMDYVEGVSMDKVIANNGPQAAENILDWGMQICDVFDYLHHQPQPVIYRDMKPANIILQPNGNIMMIDFGTARTQKIGQYMQADTICIGTEGFAAPEQFGGISQSDARTDIFCLGATLYNMYTGHSPCDPPKGICPLDRFDPALVGTPLDLIIQKCTRNDPAERYQTALELKQDLALARSGRFETESKRGKSGLLRKSGFQSQELKPSGGAGTGLSGLLGRSRNKTANSGDLKTSTETPRQSWNVQQNETGGLLTQPPAAKQVEQWTSAPAAPAAPAEEPVAPESGEDSIWKRVTLFSAIVAAVLLLASGALVLADLVLAGEIGLCLTAAAVILAVVGVIMEYKQRNKP